MWFNFLSSSSIKNDYNYEPVYKYTWGKKEKKKEEGLCFSLPLLIQCLHRIIENHFRFIIYIARRHIHTIKFNLVGESSPTKMNQYLQITTLLIEHISHTDNSSYTQIKMALKETE